jgi:capsid assembly protease
MSILIRIAERVLNRPLMILPDKLALIASVLEGRIGIDATELRELAQRAPDASRFTGSHISEDGRRVKHYRVEKGVAMIPVLGSLVNRGAWLGARSGMTSYEGLAFQLAQASADDDVKSIVLDIDSPGGEAVGAFEMADKVRSAAKSKSVVAVVNGMAASAAYAIASAASQIVSSPSGVAGSIGVVLMHADYSVALHQKGIKPTLIHAGAHKVDGNPYEPLSADVKSDLQAEVDSFYSLFVSSVAQGRKGRMTEKAIRSTEARTYIGQVALDACSGGCNRQL